MKEYRAKLKRQIIWMIVGIIFSCMIIVICCVSAMRLGADEHEASFMRGFQSGMRSGCGRSTSRSTTSGCRPSRGSRAGQPTASACSDF